MRSSSRLSCDRRPPTTATLLDRKEQLQILSARRAGSAACELHVLPTVGGLGMSSSASRVVDSDAHVLEPADLWIRYLEPEHVDRAIRIERDRDGLEVLVIDGTPVESTRGTLGTLGGIGMDANALQTPAGR